METDQQQAASHLIIIKVVGWILSVVIVCVGGVVYLEQRHQVVMEQVTVLKSDLGHLQKTTDDLADKNDLEHEHTRRALTALSENDYELALEVSEAMYCCEISHLSKKKKATVKKRTPKEILSYDVAYKKNPGIVVKKLKKE
jgi:hypothetical protein